MKDSPGSLGSLRHRNRLRIIDVLRRSGQSSRVDLVRLTGLSRTTVSKLVAELQADGLVVERPEADGDGAVPQSVGRPAVALALNPAAGAAIGIDFGHNRVRIAVYEDGPSVVRADIRDDGNSRRTRSRSDSGQFALRLLHELCESARSVRARGAGRRLHDRRA